MGVILWPDSDRRRKMARELKGDLKFLQRKAIRLIDAWVLTESSIKKVKARLKKLRGK